jgi:hypothetical protein
VSTSVVKWSEGLRNRVSIVTRRYTDHMKFYSFFHIFWVLLSLLVCMVVCLVSFCLVLYIMCSYCYVCSVLYILFHFVVLCIVCVSMRSVLLPPGVNPITVNEYTIPYLLHGAVHTQKNKWIFFASIHETVCVHFGVMKKI